MKITPKGTKKFTKKEKISIVRESERVGVKAVLAKYDLYPGTFYYWRKKMRDIGASGLDHGMTKERQAEITALKKENALLKQLLAEEKLEGALKTEMLKKKYPQLRDLK